MGRFKRAWAPVGMCAVIFVAGCAAGPNPIDPYEKNNRAVYNFNNGLDRIALKPLADGYVKFIPRPIRIGLGNAFDNLVYGNVIFNDFLQGKTGQGLGDLGRMAVNSIVGVGGIFDVAAPWHLPAHQNDFGLTLAQWGAKPGAYLVLPLFGPSSVRDAPGLGVEILTNPITWINAPLAATIPLATTDFVDLRSRGDVLVRFRDQAALDPYVFTRDAYLQYRQGRVREGSPTPATQPDQSLYDVDETPASAAPLAQPATQSPTYLGADISGLVGGGRAGAVAPRFQENGHPDSEIAIMTRHGFNAFRLRVFVSPVRRAPNNSLENTIKLAKQIKAAGATFLLDIHYSDTWADPQHQDIPLAWRSMDAAALEKQVEQYSGDVITQLKNAGAMPDMVQVGNETTGGMLWPIGQVQVPRSTVKAFSGNVQPIKLPQPYDDARQWNNLTRFLKAGIRGVRAAAPVKIVIHIDCGGDWPITQWYFDHLSAAGVDYDIIGQSFYPNYHGTLTELANNMAECDRRFHKPFLVAETGYPQTGGEAITSRRYMQWPGTPAGQLQFMADLLNTVRSAPGELGVFYWAPEPHGRGNGLWTGTGEPDPALSVLDHLNALTTRPASQLPLP